MPLDLNERSEMNMTEQIIFEAPVDPRKAEQRGLLALVDNAQTDAVADRMDIAKTSRAKRGQQYFRQMGLAA